MPNTEGKFLAIRSVFIKNISKNTKNFCKTQSCVCSPEGTNFFGLFTGLLLLILLPFTCLGQWNNQAFYLPRSLNPADTQQLRLNVYLQGFNKNNEYFGRVVDGYTLFGIQAQPWLSYQPTKKLRFEGGLVLQKDFGTDSLITVAPMLGIRYQQGPAEMLFGLLEGGLNHRLIEPMYGFERSWLDPIEEGLQLKIDTRRLWLDVWIDWERMIYQDSPFQEEVSGGTSLQWTVLPAPEGQEGWELMLPFQFIAYHKGGQIDTSPNPLITLAQVAAGAEIAYLRPNADLHRLAFSAYSLGSGDFSFEQAQVFKDGFGAYLNATAAYRHFWFQLSYWYGNEFLALKGDPRFQSVAIGKSDPGLPLPERSVLLLRTQYEHTIAGGLTATSRFTPYYDFSEGRFNFSFGLYLNYRTSFRLLRVKHE